VFSGYETLLSYLWKLLDCTNRKPRVAYLVTIRLIDPMLKPFPQRILVYHTMVIIGLLFAQYLTAKEINPEWITRLPNGNIRLDTSSLELDLAGLQLSAILEKNPKKRFRIDFSADPNREDKSVIRSTVTIGRGPEFPAITKCNDDPGGQCMEIDFGPSTRGWYNLQLTEFGKSPDKSLSKKLLVGYNLEAKITNFHSEDDQGPHNQFQISVNDPNGFEDISKVFLVLSESRTVADGTVVGVDLDEHRFFEGYFFDSNFTMEFEKFSMLDIRSSTL
jgi:hypothetical protein